MEYFSATYFIWAIGLGAISAFSLPLGSVVGLQTKLRPVTISVLTAFGAGALIAALAVELVAPTVYALEGATGGSHHGDPYANFYALVTGAVMGGCLFVVLDKLVNAHGGFLRRTSKTITYFTARKRNRQIELLKEIAPFPLLNDLSPEHINSLIATIRPVEFSAGEIIAREGEAGTQLFFIIKGTLDATSSTGLMSELNEGNVAGIISLIMGIPHPGTLTCRETVTAYALSKVDFDQLRALSPEFDKAARELTTQRLEFLEKLVAAQDERSIKWIRQAERALKTGAQIPNAFQLQKAKEEHKGAPLAIWLGILIDGIPESFVIGSGLLVLLQTKVQQMDVVRFGDVVPYTLIAGLFLSNFPEALASSANMRVQGWGKQRVFLLWFSLMVITAAGAGGGFLLADTISRTWLSFAEGLAAGAMLTMIAAAMIPEAIHMGRANAVGLSTLAGFLAAISFKLLE
jgi:CRP-like cAMP-binding protein